MGLFAGLPGIRRRVVCVESAVHTQQIVRAPRMRSFMQRPAAERVHLHAGFRREEHLFRAPVLLSYVPGQRTLQYQSGGRTRIETRLFDAPRQRWKAT